MKKAIYLLMWLGTFCAMAQNKVVESYSLREPIALRKPVMNDTINLQGGAYEKKMLLKTPISLSAEKGKSEVMVTDTTGYLLLEKPEKEASIYLSRFFVSTDRFAKVKLKVTSPNYLDVYIDGTKTKSKETLEDSISLAGNIQMDLRLEPATRYEVVVKLLTASDDQTDPAVKCEIINDNQESKAQIELATSMKKRFLLPNTVFGKRVNSVSLSHDGKYLLTRYSDYYDLSHSRNYTTLTETKSGRVLLTEMGKNLRWMPKSNKLYYTVIAEEGVDLITLDPKTMTETTLFEGIYGESFTWSPNEDYLIYTPVESAPYEQGALIRVDNPGDRIPNTRNSWFLSKYDIAKGVSEQITFGNHSTHLQDIRPDGKKLIYTTSRDNYTQRPFSLSSMYEIDLETLAVDTLLSDEPFMGNAHYSPDGKTIVMVAGPEAYGKIGMNCGNHPIPNNYDQQAFLMDLSTRKITPISKEFNPSLSFHSWNEYDGNIYFKADDEDCVNVYRYNVKQAQWEKLDLMVDVVRSFTLSEENTLAAYTGVGIDYSTKAYWFDIKSQKSKLLADPMQKTLSEIELGKVEDWAFTNSEGTSIKGTICYPPQFDQTKKYPLIVYYYGGTTPTQRVMESPYAAQLFASRGYVVYVVQPSGTIGFGQEFSARHVNAWGKRTANDIIEGTKKLCETHSFINDHKIGCLGASYGGFMTMYLQTQTDMFAAAISHAGISNVTSYWGEGYWGFGYNGVAAADSYPWNNPELFTKQGALFNADKINTPLLLLHGTVDTNVPIGESIQMFNALKILGKEVEFIQVQGENHFVSDYNKRVLWHNSIMAWFAKWLQDDDTWWNDLYPKRYL